MGIKFFFSKFKEYGTTYKLPENESLRDINVCVDTLLIDLNGIIHSAAQKVYQYGNHKPPQRFLGGNNRKPRFLKTQEANKDIFDDICKSIEHLIDIAQPMKTLFLAVDGVAPLGKQAQQRQRRFKGSQERNASPSPCQFDSCAITPGSKFMDHMSKYIDWYIRKRVTESEKWQRLNIIFSNEKVPAEGEHKCVQYVRKFGKQEETFCLCGVDADLIMLALGTHKPNFYILREDNYDPTNAFYCIDIGKTRSYLASIMKWEEGKGLIDEKIITKKFVGEKLKETTTSSSKSAADKPSLKKQPSPSSASYTPQFTEMNAINDFIFLAFAIGNDFLPHIPSIEVLEGGIELIIETYKINGAAHGHITKIVNSDKGSSNMQFDLKSFSSFMFLLGQHERENIEGKLNKKEAIFKDEQLERCISFSVDKNTDGNYISVDLEKYKGIYYYENFEGVLKELEAGHVEAEVNIKETKKLSSTYISVETICREYMEGMSWVLNYYIAGVPSWQWKYPFHYAPFASDLSTHAEKFTFPIYPKTYPNTAFWQLLSVLPPNSAGLLPYPLDELLVSDVSPLKKYCPDKFKVDLSGKRKEYEGIVILPMFDPKVVEDAYNSRISLVDPRDLKRDIAGKTFGYKYNPEKRGITFKSFYSDIAECKADVFTIDLDK